MPDLIDRFALRDALYEADAVTMMGVKIINQFPAIEAMEVPKELQETVADLIEWYNKYSDDWEKKKIEWAMRQAWKCETEGF